MATDTGPLIILGGSNCQVNAFRMAKQRGQHTVLFDYLQSPPAAALADVHLQVSTFDAEACTTAAGALAPAGVMTLGTDQPVYTAARMAKALGLPTLLDEETAFAATNKARMKKILTESGIPTVPWRLVDERALAALPAKGPVVIKPLDSQGQKGVFLAQSPQVAAGWYAQSIAFSRLDKLLCEEYYPSEEITVSAWVQNGVPTVLSVTDRVTFTHARHIGVCAAHRFPSRAAAGHEETLAALTRQICSAFAIPAGPLYIQYLVGAKGVVVNEIACRIGGAFEDVFIPFLTGFDILAAVMDAALGAPAAVVPAFAP
ncbi:hypothetical protein LJC04_02800, partial [Ruminococcaceae bacterium OttesenSCG-928-O06]|nr:hypothetical protein [Ruminococcaceae bacterium OttesenSCG-928-O06]